MRNSKSIVEQKVDSIYNVFMANMVDSIEFSKIVPESLELKKEEFNQLLNYGDDPKKVEQWLNPDIIDKIKRDIKRIDRFPLLINRLAFLNSVANFEAFFYDMLEMILLENHKEFENSDSKLTYREALQAKSLINLIVNKEIRKMRFERIDKTIGHLERKYKFHCMDFNMDKNRDEIENRKLRLVTIFQNRNLLLHNRGRVNEEYLHNLPNTEYSKGQKIKIDFNYFIAEWPFIVAMASTMYKSFKGKILPSKSYCLQHMLKAMLPARSFRHPPRPKSSRFGSQIRFKSNAC